MMARTLAMLLLLLITPLMANAAEDELRRVKVTVIDVSGPILVINRGQQAGLQRGDSVVFPRAGRPPLLAVVLIAHEREAKLELEDGEARASIGLRGEVLIPMGRTLAASPADAPPDHPPWKAPVGLWESGKPLLAPITSPKPQERKSDIYGRVSTRFQDTDDSMRDRHSSRLRTSIDYNHTNPFRQGGALRFKGDLFNQTDESAGTTEEENDARLERFSYAIGTGQGDPRRIEVGRFLPHLFPQFGLLDGAECITRTSSGLQLGVNAGFLPGYERDLGDTEDVALALFGRWASGKEERFAAKLGLQKTWHRGDADRDLLASGLHWRIDPRFTFRASALADYFDGSDSLESQGLKLTQAHASLDWQFGASSSASLYASLLDWPELLKDQSPELLPSTVQDQRVLRGGVSSSLQLSKRVRLFGRYDSWSDDLNSGTFADARLDLRDLLYGGSELSLGLFDTQGSFSSGLGARLRHTHWMRATQLALAYETTQYEQSGFQGIQSELQQQVVSFNVNTPLRSDLDLFAEALQRFGDEQDSFTMSVRLTWRF